jgi:hypothetical protein
MGEACANCGSTLDVAEGPPSTSMPEAPRVRRCISCGHVMNPPPPPAPPAPMPRPGPPPMMPHLMAPPPPHLMPLPPMMAPPRSSNAGWIIALIAVPVVLVLFLIVGLVGYAQYKKAKRRKAYAYPYPTYTPPRYTSPRPTPTIRPPPPPSTPKVQFFANAGPIVPVAVNADGVEDFIAAYQLYSFGSRPLYVAAIDGATMKELWKVGPFGDAFATTTTRGVRYGVAGKYVVVADNISSALVLDLATGATTSTVSLPSRVMQLCVSPPGTHVWLALDGGGDLLVDPKVPGSAVPTARPAWCKRATTITSVPYYCTRMLTQATCVRNTTLVVPGFRADYALESGSDGIAIGRTTVGTYTPVAVGYDTRTQAQRWKVDIGGGTGLAYATTPRPADIVDGRFVTQYRLSGGMWHAIAFDPKTGAKLWDTEMPKSSFASEGPWIISSKSRVYVPHGNFVDVFDASSGDLQGTFGE